MRPSDEDVIGTRPQKPTAEQQVEGLGLFAEFERALDKAEGVVGITRLSKLVMPGAGQLARRIALESTDRAKGLNAVRKALADAPAGLTRVELHQTTGLPINTVNARVADLCKLGEAFTDGLRETPDDDGRVVKGSVVHLRVHQRNDRVR